MWKIMALAGLYVEDEGCTLHVEDDGCRKLKAEARLLMENLS